MGATERFLSGVHYQAGHDNQVLGMFSQMKSDEEIRRDWEARHAKQDQLFLSEDNPLFSLSYLRQYEMSEKVWVALYYELLLCLRALEESEEVNRHRFHQNGAWHLDIHLQGRQASEELIILMSRIRSCMRALREMRDYKARFHVMSLLECEHLPTRLEGTVVKIITSKANLTLN